ncbi:FMN-dependent NADH-azoreductase [Alkalihalobacillus hwajinpoensis]|uniref:FMN-dependent NADH-azoreductase n=1 Tax=Guptibacillus hwajinpoensis TaxID=208199 RepID=UPI001883189D|nr:FMN-dependent NADH-azoreductase [Pseudalkalibacillus hwajinpoensis]MBF0707274.1 FMN-dependent NADH-azoreductase [Pseudalkalibacillus hwajinpoensis]
MARLLYITVNPKPVKESFSLSIGEVFLETYQEKHQNDDVVKLDLYNIDLPYIDTDVFNGWGKLQQGNAFDHLSGDEQLKVSKINDLTDQFISADKYVFVTPFWNFSFPPKLKAYIDTVAIAGKTFKYTKEGPVGLLTDKKALHIQARGGIYSEGPAKEMEFGDRYLHAVLGFLGIPSVESVIAEGMAQMPEKAEEIKKKAMEEAKQAAKTF